MACIIDSGSKDDPEREAMFRRIRDALAGQDPPSRRPGIPVRRPLWLSNNVRQILPAAGSPSTLLRPERRVVPFQGAAAQSWLQRLMAWCERANQPAMRVLHGAGGAGKTRLAVELCSTLEERASTPWAAGFLVHQRALETWHFWGRDQARNASMLVVVDEAALAVRSGALARLLEEAGKCPARRLRLLLLDRGPGWWHDLKSLPGLHGTWALAEVERGVRDGWRLSEAMHPAEAQALHAAAVQAYGAALHGGGESGAVPVPAEPPRNWSWELQVRALLTAAARRPAGSDDALLGQLLQLDREHWRATLAAEELPELLLPLLEAAVKVVARRGGARFLDDALDLLHSAEVPGRPGTDLSRRLAFLLNGFYRSETHFIAPLQPLELRSRLLESA